MIDIISSPSGSIPSQFLSTYDSNFFSVYISQENISQKKLSSFPRGKIPTSPPHPNWGHPTDEAHDFVWALISGGFNGWSRASKIDPHNIGFLLEPFEKTPTKAWKNVPQQPMAPFRILSEKLTGNLKVATWKKGIPFQKQAFFQVPCKFSGGYIFVDQKK